MSADRQLALLWGAVALVLVAAAPWAPALAAALPPCQLRAVFGLPCPTCGATRALMALAELEVLEALRFNPLVTTAAVGFVAAGWVAALRALSGRSPGSLPNRLPLPARLLAVGVVLANWLYVVLAGV